MKSSVFVFVAFVSLFSCTFTPKVSINNVTNDHPLGNTLKFPKAEFYVNDFDHILTDDQQKELNALCANYDEKTTNQIVVATFKSYEPYEKMETFCTDLFNEWGVGTKEKSNGLMIIVFKDLHKARIEAGYGTEKVLTNDVCDQIMQQQLIPNFREGKFYEGIKAGIEKSIELWK